MHSLGYQYQRGSFGLGLGVSAPSCVGPDEDAAALEEVVGEVAAMTMALGLSPAAAAAGGGADGGGPAAHLSRVLAKQRREESEARDAAEAARQQREAAEVAAGWELQGRLRSRQQGGGSSTRRGGGSAQQYGERRGGGSGGGGRGRGGGRSRAFQGCGWAAVLQQGEVEAEAERGEAERGGGGRMGPAAVREMFLNLPASSSYFPPSGGARGQFAVDSAQTVNRTAKQVGGRL